MDGVVEAFNAISITAASDALDRPELHGACLGISPVNYGYHMVGRAFTVKYYPVSVDKGTVSDYIDDVPRGGVVVLDNSGRLDCTVWGDILTLVAHRNGIAGTVIDGVCREVKRSVEIGYPIFSRGRFMRTGKDRVQAVGVNVPVQMGGVQVRPGDLVLGSDDGVVIVPKEKVAEVLSVARLVEETEEKIRAEVLKGIPLQQARRKHGYHELQRRQDKNAAEIRHK
jgi:4-hydroxy-4-methyl-2-oxoglutarate aldolase